MYEEGTALTKQRRLNLLTPCDEDVEAEMYERTIDVLTASGYEHYEISNFARSGLHCRHNMIYWRNQEYVGVGPSAVSYVGGVRTKNVADVRRYAEGVRAGSAIVIESERLEGDAHARETAIQMLRLTAGIPVAEFEAATGFDPFELFAEPIARFTETRHIEATDAAIRLTRAGMLVANRIMAEFLNETGEGTPRREGMAVR